MCNVYGYMVVGSKQIKRMICLACKDIIGDHSFNKLGKCLIRIQSELLLNTNGYDKVNKKERGNQESSTVGEIGDRSDHTPSIETMDKDGDFPNGDLNEDISGQKKEPDTLDGELGYNEIESRIIY